MFTYISTHTLLLSLFTLPPHPFVGGFYSIPVYVSLVWRCLPDFATTDFLASADMSNEVHPSSLRPFYLSLLPYLPYPLSL